MPEKIWFRDIQGFFTKKNFLNFFPRSDMSFEEQINSIIRFFIYLLLLIYLIDNDYRVIYIFIGVLIITTAMYYVKEQRLDRLRGKMVIENLEKSRKTNKVCRKPTVDNPFMNPLVPDYEEGSQLQKIRGGCDIEEQDTKEDVYEKYSAKLYRSIDDIFLNHSGDRQFYSMPNTDVINDQTGFAEWLYKRPNCKSGYVEKCHKDLNEVIMGRV